MEGATLMGFSYENKIPEWIIFHLRKYGNCCCGREIVKRIGKEEILKELKKEGFSCILRIVYDYKYKPMRKVKYPVNASYIIEIESVVKSYFI